MSQLLQVAHGSWFSKFLGKFLCSRCDTGWVRIVLDSLLQNPNISLELLKLSLEVSKSFCLCDPRVLPNFTLSTGVDNKDIVLVVDSAVLVRNRGQGILLVGSWFGLYLSSIDESRVASAGGPSVAPPSTPASIIGVSWSSPAVIFPKTVYPPAESDGILESW